jgi:hypothetical protein
LQISLEVLECRFNFDQLHVELPQLSWFMPAQIGAQEVAAFRDDAPFLTVKGDVDESTPLVPPHPCGMREITRSG